MTPRRRHAARTAASLIVLAAFVAAGVTLQIARPDDSNAPPLDVHFGAAHFPTYKNLEEMNRRSTIVVQARVERILAAHRVFPPGVSPSNVPKAKRSRLAFIETEASINVIKRIAGRSSPKVVRISQLGGQIGNERLVVEGEPLVTQGRTYVLFLRRAKSGVYVVVGGSQGRYLVEKGKLSVVSGEALAFPVSAVLHGLRATTFSRQYGALLHSTVFSRAVPRPATNQQPLKRRVRAKKPVATGGKPPAPPGR